MEFGSEKGGGDWGAALMPLKSSGTMDEEAKGELAYSNWSEGLVMMVLPSAELKEEESSKVGGAPAEEKLPKLVPGSDAVKTGEEVDMP